MSPANGELTSYPASWLVTRIGEPRSEVLDLEPATRTLTDLVEGVRDDQLAAPTPCREMSVGDLLDHIDRLSMAFTAAARKASLPGGSQGPSVDASHLGPHWRTRIPERLTELGAAWRDESAWAGMTQAGGQDLPAELAGVIALDEVVIHGWDLAVATGQGFNGPPELLEAAYGFVEPTAAQNPEGTPGLFGPPVPVREDAPLFERLLGLTGRDPAWSPGGPAA
jgi:uncharacterized protein (TIGR03086 family)